MSGQSRFDKAFAANGVPNFAASFTADEIVGEQVFRTAGCVQCHTTLAQVADAPHNTGLDAVTIDIGTGNGAMKSPSLRNVAVRPRFMHDGRFTTLEQVVDFYDSGVQPNPALDPRLRTPNGAPRRLGLTTAEKRGLVAFMKTLTDSTFLADTRLSNPFATPVVVPPVSTNPIAATVTMQFTAYRPPIVTVAPGAVITFTNLDNTQHSAQFAASSIASTPRFTNGSRTVTMPTAPGTYSYQCSVHGQVMIGSIVVR